MSLNYLIFAKRLEIFELKVLSSRIQVQCHHNWNESLYARLPSASLRSVPLAQTDMAHGYHPALHASL